MTALADRVRALLAEEAAVREVAMFGGLSFLVDGGMAVSVRGSGALLVRIPAGRHDELLALPGVTRPAMGGRVMGRGWVEVAAESVGEDAALAFWVGVAVEGVRASRLA